MEQQCLIELEHRKMFCMNPDCPHKTFAEPFECVEPCAQHTKRLNEKVTDTVAGMRSVAAAEQLRIGVCTVSKSTICREPKKRLKQIMANTCMAASVILLSAGATLTEPVD